MEEEILDEELSYELEHLLEVTYQIYSLYERLIDAELSNIDNNALIIKLKKLKEKENEIYEYFKDNPHAPSTVLIYINKNLNSNLSSKDSLVVWRIINNLNIINSAMLSINPEVIPNGTLNQNAVNYLINAGYSEEDSYSIVLKIAFFIDKSLSTAICNLCNHTLSSIKDNEMKLTYLKRKYHEVFKFGNVFEDELLANSFKPLNNHLKEEISFLEENSTFKQKLLSILLEPNIRRVISSYIEENDPDLKDEFLNKFKAYMLHLDIPELEQYSTIITILSLVYNFNSNILLNEIKTIINLRNKANNKTI